MYQIIVYSVYPETRLLCVLSGSGIFHRIMLTLKLSELIAAVFCSEVLIFTAVGLS